MKNERLHEYARMLLGPVRYGNKETRSEAIHTLHCMLDEEKHTHKAKPKPPDQTRDAVKIDQSQTFNAITLAKGGMLSPWKKRLVKALGL